VVNHRSNCPKQAFCIVVFWVITPCSLVDRYQCSERASAKKMGGRMCTVYNKQVLKIYYFPDLKVYKHLAGFIILIICNVICMHL
jgi:hypothetical protein